MTNPFQQAPAAPAPQAPAAPQQPMIPDAAAQQFAPQQEAPSQAAFAPGHGYTGGQGLPQAPAQAQQFAPSPQTPNGELHTQAHGFAHQQAPAAPQGLPGQPWSPQQHQQNVPQAYAPPAALQQQAPAAAPQGLPQAPFPPAQAQTGLPGFGGAQAPAGGAFDPSMFGAPSAGGGNYPKVRDLNGRLCLFRVKNRMAAGTAYGDNTKAVNNYIANVAVLDGGPLYSSPSQDDPMGTPVLVSETVPYVIGDMTIGQVGLQNRLKADFVRGRVVRMPKGKMAEALKQQFPGMEDWQALWTYLAQDASREAQLVSGTYFWGIAEDNSEQANQIVQQFSTNPIARELML